MFQKIPRRLRKWFTWLCITGLGLVLLAVGGVFGGEGLIRLAAQGRVYAEAGKVPQNDVAVVLGTSKKVVGGQINIHFHNRMVAAAELYKAGKVRHILVSGANPTKYYDEPTDMLNYLVNMGVPAEAITRDYAGFRTLDTVVRAREIFGLERYVIVTDKFHTYRTLFLARHTGADCVAYAARDIDLRWSLKSKVRERFANLKALLDIYVLRTQPKFLGPKESIQIAAGPTEESAVQNTP
jgi:SanA protein